MIKKKLIFLSIGSNLGDKIENIKFKTIEIMISTYPPKSELILANNTIDRGFLLANKATN